jgi:hypothetical protein
VCLFSKNVGKWLTLCLFSKNVGRKILAVNWYVWLDLESAECLLHVLHVDGHELGHEGLQVEDGLASLV